MKLLYIANVRIPTEKAYGMQIVKTCEAFARVGVDIELVIPSRRNKLMDNPLNYYGVCRNSFKLTILRVPDFVRYGRLGFLLSSVWFSEYIRWKRLLSIADVIYSRDALILLQYSFLGHKLVFEAHAKPSFIARIVARRVYRVVVISRALRDAYIEAGVPAAHIIVAPDAVDEHLFDHIPTKSTVRKMLGLSLTEQIVMYTGHLYVRKGVDTLAETATHMPDISFVFVGGTLEDIERFRKRWGRYKNIHIVGYVVPKRVPLYLGAADVLVIPNSSKSEDTMRFASPMKLFEYMASGSPILASDVPAIREVLGESEATFFTADDPAALGAGIRCIISQGLEGKLKAEGAQKKVREYTWEQRASSIYKSLQ